MLVVFTILVVATILAVLGVSVVTYIYKGEMVSIKHLASFSFFVVVHNDVALNQLYTEKACKRFFPCLWQMGRCIFFFFKACSLIYFWCMTDDGSFFSM